MRAAVFERFGEPADVLEVRDVPVPQPGRGEVRVRMLASPVNPSDLLEIRGQYSARLALPAIPGHEGVGVVEASGGGLLGRMLVGKRVAVLNRKTGNWCEQTVIPARQAIPLPDDLPLEQAAMFFINPATAYVMTRRVLAVPRGAWLLQTAAGSALGRMVIRLGRHYGFRTLNVVRRAEQADELQALGGDAVVAFDPRTDSPESFRQRVFDLVGDGGVRYAIEPVGGATGSAVVACLGEAARMLVYGTLADEPLAVPPRRLIETGATIEGFFLAQWAAGRGLLVRLGLVRRIIKLIRSGVLVSPVGQSFPLVAVADAVRKAEEPARGGKVLLRFEEHPIRA
ncbi:MAG TPA: zinc-dependent alcohol dehydrogenase family protein [Planctomycetaceae bacterium]|nr:zinc-dependent alcohol dehydrogenase family protein [Planctomycetaceae bacterium]